MMTKHKSVKIVVATSWLTMLLLSSCQNSTFQGLSDDKSRGKGGGGGPGDGSQTGLTPTLVTTCDFPEASDIKVRASAANIPQVLKGTICPPNGSTTGQALNQVILIVDVSGSTSISDRSSGNSCGRLTATKDLLRAFRQHPNSAAITLAIITFAGSARLVTGFKPLAEIDSNVNYDNLCSNGKNMGSGTNYEAAFSMAAQQMAGGLPGKLLYLLSDGMPQGGNSRGPRDEDSAAKAAGESAVNQCRSIDPSMQLLAVYLNAGAGSTSPDAYPYLTSLTGSAHRVAVVSDAGSLGAAAVKLLQTSVKVFTISKAEATLSAPGFAAVHLGIDIDPSVTSENGKAAIGFISRPFKLLGDPANPMRQLLQVIMTDVAGMVYQKDFYLSYDPTQ